MRIQSLARAASTPAPAASRDEYYTDRVLAGRRLAALLRPYRSPESLVLAISPGGVIVAGEIAHALRLPLDVLIVREFRVPTAPMLAVGALSEGGGLCLNATALRFPQVKLPSVWYEAQQVWHEIAGLIKIYRPGRGFPGQHQIILVDDGIGSGLAQLAAIHALRYHHVHRCVVTTPGGSSGVLQTVALHADALVTLTIEEPHYGWFEPWRQTISDADAAVMLEEYRTFVGMVAEPCRKVLAPADTL